MLTSSPLSQQQIASRYFSRVTPDIHTGESGDEEKSGDDEGSVHETTSSDEEEGGDKKESTDEEESDEEDEGGVKEESK